MSPISFSSSKSHIHVIALQNTAADRDLYPHSPEQIYASGVVANKQMNSWKRGSLEKEAIQKALDECHVICVNHTTLQQYDQVFP